ncbi:MAG: O-methyltransferase [Lachnospiraceae bacterium]|nr:O-methyltransferase [Lachnospiraceae bacterium]
MIVEERMVAYINSLDIGNTPLLDEIEREARQEGVPIIRRELQSFLKTLLAWKNPGQILEVGTATGFSALLMSEYGGPKVKITTIEKYEKRLPIARENFRRAGREKQITLLEGDAMEILPKLSGLFDFIFMDAAKGQYLHFLPQVLRLLSPGGLLVSDNVLQEGRIIDSRFAVERRDRTIHSRMREYLYALKHHPQLVTSILPLGDGVTVSVKIEELENSGNSEMLLPVGTGGTGERKLP